MSLLRIRAAYMRGGTSKGVFFVGADLPADPALRERILLRVMGSPDRYGKQIDGMGGATSSTSKVVLVSPSERADCDVDYLFGQVGIEQPVIDWSGNCGNLSAAVAPFAIARGLVAAADSGLATVRIWQANIGKVIVAHVPVRNGQPEEEGDFELDGVAFAAAPVRLEFLDPGGAEPGPEGASERASESAAGRGPVSDALFPTGKPCDTLDIAGLGPIEATLINAGNPTVFVAASALGLSGREGQADINGDDRLLARFEAIRAQATVAMGLAASADEATRLRPATPKIAFVAAPAPYLAADGRPVQAEDIDLLVRILSMGKLHHAITGTGAIAVAVAAAIPDTLVARTLAAGRAASASVRIGHASGVLEVGAEAERRGDTWRVSRALVTRSARMLMDGVVSVPAP